MNNKPLGEKHVEETSVEEKSVEEKSVEERPSDESLEDQVYEAIKRAILQRELKPGAQISYATWAKHLSVSRTPVRDAFKRLENEGFIIRESERQWYVYVLTLADVHNLHATRMAVEGYMARLAARHRTGEQIETMMELIEAMEEAIVAKDRTAFRRADSHFHQLIEEACQNPYLARISHHCHEMLTRLRTEITMEGRLQVAVEENQMIAHAVLEQDEDAAEAAQRRHIRASWENMVLLLEQMVIPIVGDHF